MASSLTSSLAYCPEQPYSATIPRKRVALFRWFALIGPAFAISVGYIDPGNWATDLAAGAYGYRLLWVVLLASLIALVLQLCSARLAVITGDDLASLISRRWKTTAPFIGLLFEAAVIATDLAEFAGIVIGVEFVFRVTIGVAMIAGLATVALIFVANSGRIRGLQRSVLAMLWIVAAIVFYQLWLVAPSASAVAAGTFIPRLPDHAAILIVVGIIGATVMPHNLFLHSALIKEECKGFSPAVRHSRNRFYSGETVCALLIATLVNGAILIVAAHAGGAGGSFGIAFGIIRGYAGSTTAILFGVALAVSGVASTVTATLSNDYVVTAFSPVRMSPLLRRALAVVPAATALGCGIDPLKLIIWSQAALALVLPVVIVPLIIIMASTQVPSSLRFSRRWLIASSAAGAVCVAFDAALIALMVTV